MPSKLGPSGEKVALNLSAAQRKLVLDVLADLPDKYSQLLTKTPSRQPFELTPRELKNFSGYVAVGAKYASEKNVRQKLDAVSRKIEKLLESHSDKAPPSTAAGQLFQFKITLLHLKPLIWRRIQVQDGTLDDLHEHIQTAMGWTNSHLHQFEIDGERCGDPRLLDDGFGDFDGLDSTQTMISQIIPKNTKRFRFRFQYEYDFGDGWEHEVVFEGFQPTAARKRYPICIAGERCCPPEDVGGVWGYVEFLEAQADLQHERHEEFVNWMGPFDPDDFDVKQTTKAMQQGLPNWRDW